MGRGMKREWQVMVFFFLFLFFVCSCGTLKFPAQGLNPCHSSDPSCCSDNSGSLTHCATRELLMVLFLRCWKCSKLGDGCTTLNIWITIDLYTLNRWFVWFVGYISIKMFYLFFIYLFFHYSWFTVFCQFSTVQHGTQFSFIFPVFHYLSSIRCCLHFPKIYINYLCLQVNWPLLYHQPSHFQNYEFSSKSTLLLSLPWFLNCTLSA